jgi:hypothetical protein
MIEERQASDTGKVKVRAYYDSQPWRCQPTKDGCELIAYVGASGQWETVAVIQPTSAMEAKALGDFIVSLVNERQQDGDVLQAAFDALGGVLQEGLNFSTEQDADRVVAALKKRGF